MAKNNNNEGKPPKELTEEQKREIDRLLVTAGVCLKCFGLGCPDCPPIKKYIRKLGV